MSQGEHGEYPRYPHSVLAYRPLEHIIEDLRCRDMALALGVNKDTAMRMKRDPWENVDTTLEVTDEVDRRLREWLEGCLEDVLPDDCPCREWVKG